MQPAFTWRNRGQHPGGVLKRRWRNGKRGGLLSRQSGFDSSAAYVNDHAPLGKLVIPSDPQSGDCEFEPRTEHARPYRPMARPLAFQAGEDGSEPSRATAGSSTGRAERAHNPRQVGSTPTPATKASRAPGPVMDGKARHPHSGVVQRQDVALLRRLSGFESLRQSASECRLVSLAPDGVQRGTPGAGGGGFVKDFGFMKV